MNKHFIPTEPARRRTFLFLQGPISPFFSEISDQLRAAGHTVLKINLCFGDYLFWRRPGGINFRKSRKHWPDFIHSFLRQHNVTDIILLGEQREYHKTAIAAAQEMGISVVSTDFGYLRPDWITFEKDGMSANSRFPRDPALISSLAARCPDIDLAPQFQDSFLRMAVWDILYHISSFLLHFMYPGYKSHQKHHPVLIYLGTGLRLLMRKKAQRVSDQAIARLQETEADYFVFPLQMATDFQIRSYSPFAELDDAIDVVLRSFSHNAPAETKLVVKIHPLDPGLKNWGRLLSRLARKYNVDGRILYLTGGDLQTLLEKAKGIVTVNSTVGLWGLQRKCPVKILGEAIYDIDGLVDRQPLDRYWNSPHPPNPTLSREFFKLLADTVQIRGVFYNRPGLDAAIDGAVYRLEKDLINVPLSTLN